MMNTRQILMMLVLLAVLGAAPVSAARQGTFAVYHFTYEDHNTTTLFPERLGRQKTGGTTFMSSFTFDGDLVVKEYRDADGRNYTGFSFKDIRSNRFVLNGHDIFTQPSEFMEAYKNKEVLALLNDNHEITAFYYPQDTTQLFKTFMTTAIQEVQVSRGKGSSWNSTEFTQHGQSQVTYTQTGDSHLSKKITRYNYPGLIEANDLQDISMDTDITLDPSGRVKTLKKKETTRIKARPSGTTVMDVTKTVSLTRTASAPFDRPDLPLDFINDMQTVPSGGFISDPAQEQELLARQAAFVSYDEIEHWIASFKPDHKDNRSNNAMFYRSTGFLSLHPQSMDKLVEYATRKAQTSREKTLVMNLLAAVGNPKAQSSMREILSDPGIQKLRQYGILIQNFSFVDEKPEPETLEFLNDLIQQKGFVSYSAAHAYGAMIHTLYTEGVKQKALELNQTLVEKMNGATTVTDQSEYLAALGNAGMVENNDMITGLLQHTSPKIRAEAAMALRKTETPMARKQLIHVFKDRDRSVQRSAIQTCLHFNPGKDDLKTIADQLDREEIQEANYYDLVTLLEKNSATLPELTQKCLRLMVRKKLKDPDLEARIRGMITKKKTP